MGWLLAAFGPAVVGGSLTGSAHAADEAEVGALLQDLETATAGDLVVCAAGEDAEDLVKRLLKAAENPSGTPPPRVERIPVLGVIDDEAERVRAEAGVQCALWVRQAGEAWEAGSVGPCTAPETPSLPTVVAAEPALDADPTDVPVAAQPVLLTEGPRKLVMAELNPDPADMDGVNWHIVDEQGVSWSTYRFAESVGDIEMVGTLDRELAVASKERKALLWGGLGVIALSPVPMLLTSNGSYERNQDLAWTSLFLAATGGMTVAIHKRGVQSTKRRQLRPAHYYSRADSEALVGAHNARVDAYRAEVEQAPPPGPPPADSSAPEETSAAPDGALPPADGPPAPADDAAPPAESSDGTGAPDGESPPSEGAPAPSDDGSTPTEADASSSVPGPPAVRPTAPSEEGSVPASAPPDEPPAEAAPSGGAALPSDSEEAPSESGDAPAEPPAEPPPEGGDAPAEPPAEPPPEGGDAPAEAPPEGGGAPAEVPPEGDAPPAEATKADAPPAPDAGGGEP